MLAGVSPRLKLDEAYSSFLGLVADQVGVAVAHVRAQAETRRRMEALAELDRAKTAFFSNVSHELRTPLTLILGPVEDRLANTEEPLPPREHEWVELVRRNAQRLEKLVNTLLEFARHEEGRARATFQPLDLAALTRELASLFESAAQRAGLSLTVDCPPLPETVWVDPEAWEKVVLNLVSNAVKYTHTGGTTVRLRAAGAAVLLEVEDVESSGGSTGPHPGRRGQSAQGRVPLHRQPRAEDAPHRHPGLGADAQDGKPAPPRSTRGRWPRWSATPARRPSSSRTFST